MKKVLVLSIVLAVLSTSIVYARRDAPKDVPSITHGKIEYRAPHGQMGCVEAWQGKTLIWRRQIYVVKYTVNLERDVQDVFIKTLALKGTTLTVTNERASEYELDLESLEVKVVKGSLVESRE